MKKKKMLKKLIEIFIIVVLIMGCMMKTSEAAFLEIINNIRADLNVTASNETKTTEDGFEYEILTDGTGVRITDYSGTQNEVIIPAKIEELPVLEIGNNAFYGCRSLTSITIPSNVTSIGYFAFFGCNSLMEIIVEETSNNFASIDGVLYNKEKTRLYCYPAGKKETSYEISDGVTIIGYDAFYRCSSLTNITIPESVTGIESRAFYGCSSLTSITIPSTVTGIGVAVFEACNSLMEIIVEETSNNFASIDGVLYNKEKTRLYCYPAGKKETSYEILEGVTSIEDYAFGRCTSLTSITIPDGVTSIAWRRI